MESDDDDAGISRAKLRVSDARSRFDSKRYNSAGVDWSDRLDSKRLAYRTSARSRVLDDGTEQLGDLSDEDEGEAAESLERKIARLKREVEEAKEEYARNQAAAGDKGKHDEADGEVLGSLGQVLEEISRPAGVGRATRMPKTIPQAENTAEDTTQHDATYTVTYAPSYEQSHALAKAAEFEQRLLALEKAIGLGSTTSLEVRLNGLPRAILPTIDSLHQQISALSKASTTSLDAISRRVRTVITDIDNMNKRKPAHSQDAGRYRSDSRTGGDHRRPSISSADDEDEQVAKVNALYGTLATIESLTPLLQPLLDRLRSLRAIHADAAAASETLDRIEKQQVETAAELRQWREGLEKIERAMGEGQVTMEGNMKVMDAWVRDLEMRMAKLSP